MERYVVYKHTFPNDKIYIGITKKNPIYRWNKGKGYFTQPKIYNAILKYGWDNIKHEILFDGLSQKEAEQKEIELIKFYNSIENGYNVSTGGEYSHNGACKYKGLTVNNCEVIGVSSENKLILKCLDCGNIFKRQHQSIQKGYVKCKCKVAYKQIKPRTYCIIEYNGETHSIQEWSKILGVPIGTIRSRHKKGQDIAKRLSFPKENATCLVCGERFKKNYKNQIYCSKECQWQSMRKCV